MNLRNKVYNIIIKIFKTRDYKGLVDKNDTFKIFDEAWSMVCALYTYLYVYI